MGSARATTATTSSSDEYPDPDDDFFPDVDVNDLFSNLNMGDDNATAAAAAAALAAANAAPAAPYVILSLLFQIFLEFLVLVFTVDGIGLVYLDAICSSALLGCIISLISIPVIILYRLLIRIKLHRNLLIFSTLVTVSESRSM